MVEKTIAEIIEAAEANLISTTPGAVPPHFDDGGTLPYGGTIGNTRGPSAFGRRKATRANAIGNPQALLLNYPPEGNEFTLKCWEKNYKSSIYMDPSAEAGRLTTSNMVTFGPPERPSHLAAANQTWGNLRQTARTRSEGAAFYPPERSLATGALMEATPAQRAAADYTWKYPKRDARPPPPQIKRPPRQEQEFLEEYDLRPPWLKY